MASRRLTHKSGTVQLKLAVKIANVSIMKNHVKSIRIHIIKLGSNTMFEGYMSFTSFLLSLR